MFLNLYEVSPNKEGEVVCFGMTMVEEFVKRARHLLRGTDDVERPEVSNTLV